MMDDTETTARSWRDFQDNPLPGIHRDHLVQSLRPLRIQDDAVFRASTDAARERALLAELVRRHYALAPLAGVNPSVSDTALAVLSVNEWRNAALICGTMYWSRTLAREVRAPVLRRFDQVLGAAWWQWVQQGLLEAGRLPAAATVPGVLVQPDTPDEWLSCIRDAGFSLLRAWRDGLDEALAGWIRLKDAPGEEVARRSDGWQLDTAFGQRLVQRLCTPDISFAEGA